MQIGENGDMTTVSFWPADEIAAAFERVNAAAGTPEAVREMRLFVRVMNYFYEQATETSGDINGDEMAEICRLAKIGLIKELGMADPKEKTA